MNTKLLTKFEDFQRKNNYSPIIDTYKWPGTLDEISELAGYGMCTDIDLGSGLNFNTKVLVQKPFRDWHRRNNAAIHNRELSIISRKNPDLGKLLNKLNCTHTNKPCVYGENEPDIIDKVDKLHWFFMTEGYPVSIPKAGDMYIENTESYILDIIDSIRNKPSSQDTNFRHQILVSAKKAREMELKTRTQNFDKNNRNTIFVDEWATQEEL